MRVPPADVEATRRSLETIVFLYRLRNNKFKHYVRRRLRRPWRLAKKLPDKTKLFGARALSKIAPASLFFERGSLYPPKKICESTANWVTLSAPAAGASYREVDVACTVFNPLPKTIHDSIRRQFLAEETYRHPDTFVATIPRGRVWGDGFIITPDNQLLEDVSVDFSAEKGHSSIPDRWRLGQIKDYEGRVAVLSTDGGELYYHWLLQLLPRFELIRRAGIDVAGIDYFVVNGSSKQFQRQSIEALGIEAERIIESCNVPHLRAQELIVPSIPLGGGCFRPWMCQFLRNTFLPKDTDPNIRPPSRRLYISRGLASYRRVLNEPAVIQLLRRRGFEEITFERMSLRQQAAAMADCEAVVAPHGGGLSNLIFCSPGTKVIEIFSPELVIGFFWKLSNQLGLDYYYLLGKGHPVTRNSDYEQSWETLTDIEVELDMLEQSLDLAQVN